MQQELCSAGQLMARQAETGTLLGLPISLEETPSSITCSRDLWNMQYEIL